MQNPNDCRRNVAKKAHSAGNNFLRTRSRAYWLGVMVAMIYSERVPMRYLPPQMPRPELT